MPVKSNQASSKIVTIIIRVLNQSVRIGEQNADLNEILDYLLDN